MPLTYITIPIEGTTDCDLYQVDTLAQTRIAQRALRDAGLESARVYTSPADDLDGVDLCPDDNYANGEVLFAEQNPWALVHFANKIAALHLAADRAALAPGETLTADRPVAMFAGRWDLAADLREVGASEELAETDGEEITRLILDSYTRRREDEAAARDTMATYRFRTDAGDEDPITAESLEEAAQIAAQRITPAQWRDGAYGWVYDEDGASMAVPRPDDTAE